MYLFEQFCCNGPYGLAGCGVSGRGLAEGKVMTPATFSPQHRRPFSRGPERKSFVQMSGVLCPSHYSFRTEKFYFDWIFCVRYRYDPKGKRRLKTVELIVEKTPWQPAVDQTPRNQIMSQTTRHAVRVWRPYDELELQSDVKIADRKWNSQLTVWELPYRAILELKLVDCTVEEGIVAAECF